MSREVREALLRTLRSAYTDVVADHVTLERGVAPDTEPPPDKVGEILGVADDGRGAQAIVVMIDGTTDRPGGGTYHLTWSLDKAKGRSAVESNDVIARFGWNPLPAPRRVHLKGERFDG